MELDEFNILIEHFVRVVVELVDHDRRRRTFRIRAAERVTSDVGPFVIRQTGIGDHPIPEEEQQRRKRVRKIQLAVVIRVSGVFARKPASTREQRGCSGYRVGQVDAAVTVGVATDKVSTKQLGDQHDDDQNAKKHRHSHVLQGGSPTHGIASPIVLVGSSCDSGDHGNLGANLGSEEVNRYEGVQVYNRVRQVNDAAFRGGLWPTRTESRG